MQPTPPAEPRDPRGSTPAGTLLTRGAEEHAAEKNYTVREAAGLLGISEQTVYQLCAQKKVRHLRLGIGRGTLRIPASALDEFIAQSTVQAAALAEPKAQAAKLKHLKL
jgi:excisionase family DNA binding protein